MSDERYLTKTLAPTKTQRNAERLRIVPVSVLVWVAGFLLFAGIGAGSKDAAFVLESGFALAVLVAIPLFLPEMGPRTTYHRSWIRSDHRNAKSRVEWSDVADIQTVRQRRKMRVALRLTSGKTVILPAPYTGNGYARDPEFEAKLSELRGLWRDSGR